MLIECSESSEEFVVEVALVSSVVVGIRCFGSIQLRLGGPRERLRRRRRSGQSSTTCRDQSLSIPSSDEVVDLFSSHTARARSRFEVNDSSRVRDESSTTTSWANYARLNVGRGIHVLSINNNDTLNQSVADTVERWNVSSSFGETHHSQIAFTVEASLVSFAVPVPNFGVSVPLTLCFEPFMTSIALSVAIVVVLIEIVIVVEIDFAKAAVMVVRRVVQMFF